VGWIQLAEDRLYWQASENRVINFMKKWEVYLQAEQEVLFEGSLCSMNLLTPLQNTKEYSKHKKSVFIVLCLSDIGWNSEAKQAYVKYCMVAIYLFLVYF
jgi:hypothetical protein